MPGFRGLPDRGSGTFGGDFGGRPMCKRGRDRRPSFEMPRDAQCSPRMAPKIMAGATRVRAPCAQVVLLGSTYSARRTHLPMETLLLVLAAIFPVVNPPGSALVFLS